MSNILFFCNYQVSQPSCGGIIRVTGTLADVFRRHGHSCFLCYYYDSFGTPADCFDGRLLLNKHEEKDAIVSYIDENQIDFLFLQVPLDNSNWYLLSMLRIVVDQANHHCVLLHCYHSIPFAECKGFDLPYLTYMFRHRARQASTIKNFVWALICMMFPGFAVSITSPRYERICRYCDYLVLLSNNYIPYFLKHVDCDSKIVKGVFNPLTFPFSLAEDEKYMKTNTVLIVGRLDESTKRLSKAFKIWMMMEQIYQVDDWTLVIVGDGPDLDYYKSLKDKFNLKNVVFEGRQDPVGYYRKASIIMSTSAIEGLPMVIMEARQMGCIPISFDCYDAVRDLITDSYDGFVVKYNDLKSYASRLHMLISDEGLRIEMMNHCLEGNEKFEPDRIYKEWNTLLNF